MGRLGIGNVWVELLMHAWVKFNSYIKVTYFIINYLIILSYSKLYCNFISTSKTREEHLGASDRNTADISATCRPSASTSCLHRPVLLQPMLLAGIGYRAASTSAAAAAESAGVGYDVG